MPVGMGLVPVFSRMQALLIAAWLVLSWAPPAVAADLPELVGDRGDTLRIRFQGAEDFDAEALRGGLTGNAEFLLAAHPQAPFDKFRVALRKLLLRGYRNKGYPDVAIAVRYDAAADAVTVEIDEGPKYLCGGVEIAGAKTLSVAAVIRRLTEPWPPAETVTTIAPQKHKSSETGGNAAPEDSSRNQEIDAQKRRLDLSGTEVKIEDPIWQAGDPAPFDEGTRIKLIGTIETALEDFGYYDAKIDVRIMPDPATKKAALRVEILDEGPPGVIDDIVVTGNARDNRADILHFLELKPGMVFNREVIARTNQLLFKSARYVAYQVTAEPAGGGSGAVTLKVDLKEYGPAPPLDGDFSESEQHLLRFCSWLSDLQARGDDTIIQMSSFFDVDNFEIIFSKFGGVVTLGSGNESAGFEKRLDMILSPGRIELLSAAQKNKLQVSLPQVQLQINLSLLPAIDPSSNSEFELSFGAGFQNHRAPGAAPLRFDLLFAPAACIRWAHLKNGRETRTGDILTFASPTKGRLSIDVSTGQLREFLLLTGEKSAEVRLAVESGAFAVARRALDARKASYANRSDDRNPTNAISAFVLEEALSGWPFLPAWIAEAEPDMRRKAAVAIERIASRKVLQPVDALASRVFGGDSQWFSIPADAPGESKSPAPGMGAIWALVFRFVDQLLPRDSWPWTTARESVFVANKMSPYTTVEMRRLYASDEVGPIGFLTIAALLNYYNSPDAVPFAKRGLKRLGAAEFRRDAGLLLRGDTAIADALKRVAESLRDLSDSDITALSAVLPTEARLLFDETAARLRERRGDPVEDILPMVLDAYWNSTLRALVEAQLQKLAAP